MRETHRRDLITWLREGEITAGPVFRPSFGTTGMYAAVGYSCRFTYWDGQWTAHSITVTAAALKADGTVGRRLRDVSFLIGSWDTPDWVPQLIDRIRPTAKLEG